MHDPHQLLRVMLASVRDAVVTTDDAARVLRLNPAAEALTGWAEAEAVGRPIEEVLDLRERDPRERDLRDRDLLENSRDNAILNPARAALGDGSHGARSSQALLIGKTGRRGMIELSAYPLHDSGGQVAGCILVFYEIGEALQLAERMAHLAQHDSVTGLPNRILLVDRLEQAAKTADRHSNQLAVLFVNLDPFNDVHSFNELREIVGPAVADELLREVAYRFSEALRESDTICRLGSSEFVVLLPGVNSAEDTEALAAKLLTALARPYSLGAQRTETVTTASSIGIAIYPRDASDVATLMRLADGAMSQASEAGRNQYRFAGQAGQPTGFASEIPTGQASGE
jgi:diguanylate cyclase (GGDEF)-like protein